MIPREHGKESQRFPYRKCEHLPKGTDEFENEKGSQC